MLDDITPSGTHSPLSQIHSNARVGKGVTINPFCVIDRNVEIGDGTWIGPNVTILEGSRIGKNCKIFPGAVIGAIPQDLKFKGEETIAQIGDNTTLRECVTINRGTAAAGKTVIGSNCLIMAYVHVAHDCLVGNHVILANYTGLAGHVIIEDYAILEGMVGVQQFLRIGQHSFIAGGSLVRKNVPPFVRAAREPLTYAGINAIGLKRRGYDDAYINALHKIYSVLYVSGLTTQKALNSIMENVPDSPQRNAVIEFIGKSPKGIMKGMGHRKKNGKSSQTELENGIHTT